MVEVLAVRSSNHNPLWIRFHQDRANRIGPQQFRFEANWNLDSECSEIIQHAWHDEGCGSNLDRCKIELQKWSRAKFGQAKRTIKQLSTKLQCLQEEEKPENLENIKRLQGELNLLLEMEDMKWKQRAKRKWFRQGDRNTKFFHTWATQRRRNNFISKINDGGGNCWSRDVDVELAFTDFLKGLFTSIGSTGMEECLAAVPAWVTSAMNQILLRQYSFEEVDLALSQMQPLKASGPDGYGACLFQKPWNIVGQQVRSTVLNFLNLGVFYPGINFTYIALVPKSANASNVKGFRPISLCNVLYKVIVKVLANRLK
jgi:hypothetical protein